MNVQRRIIFGVCWLLLSARLLSAQQPELIVQTGHAEIIHSVAFSPDGKTLASGSLDKTVKLWEVTTGMLLRTLQEPLVSASDGRADNRTYVAFSPDGKLLATGGQDHSIKLWDLTMGKVSRTLTGHTASVYALAFSPDGKTLVSGSGDKTLKLWNVATGGLLRSLGKHDHTVFFVAFSPDGKSVVSSGGDNKIKLWDLATNKVRTFTEAAATITAVAFSPDGKAFATGDHQHTIKLWDLTTGKVSRRLTGHSEEINALAFSPDGKTLASGSKDKAIKLWELVTGTALRTLAGHAHTVSALAFSPDRQMLASGDWGNQIHLWDTTSAQVSRTLSGHSFYITSVAFSPDTQLIAGGSQDNTVKLWKAATGTELFSFSGHTAEVLAVAFRPDGQLLASASRDKTIRLWDASMHTALRTLSGHAEWVLAVAFSSDGKLLASASADKTIRLWDVATGALLATLAGHTNDVNAVAFSPNGETLASGSVDKTVKLWNVAARTLRRTLEGHASSVNAVAFSPDGNSLASGSTDKTVRWWNLATGTPMRSFTGHAGIVSAVVFSPDGKTLASGSWDATVKLWDVTTGQAVRTLAGHASNVSSVAFNLAGSVLASGSLDTKINLWATGTGKELGSLIALDQKDWAVVSPEGRFDASPEGMKLMHWMVGGEPIILSQLKERYYEPGLLGKLLGLNPEPLREVAAFKDIKLFPEVQFDPIVPGSNQVTVRLINRGGGIGRVQAYVNNKEIIEDARTPTIRPDSADAVLTLDLSKAPALPGQPNTLRVVPWNGEDYLSSRGVKTLYNPGGSADNTPPELYAIVAGISTYASENLSLRYAAKDALDFAAALELGAKRLFGVEKVHLTLLTTAPDPRAIAPTKANFQQAFEAAKKGKPKDVLLVYLAGHGIALQQGKDTYCYLTQEARDLQAVTTDPEIRAQTALTNAELFQLLNQVPANKLVMVLDTCAAGAAVAEFVAKRAVSSDTVRAIERLKDGTGSHVLMGSAADAFSYEASQYGQGVLTYALLQGMKGEALRDSEFVDVNQLFQYAKETVPQLARNIGGIQKPKYYAPDAGSFDVGQLKNEDKETIVLAKLKPMILRPTLINPDEGLDDLELSESLRRQLKDQCQVETRGSQKDVAALYVDANAHPDGVLASGTYTVTGQQINLRLTLVYRKQRLKSISQTGSKEKLGQLIATVTAEILKSVRELWLEGKLS